MSQQRSPDEGLRTHRAPPELLEQAMAAHRRRVERRRLALVAVTLLLVGWAAGVAHQRLSPERAPEPILAEPGAASLVELLELRAPEASSVAVAGSWNEWQATPMTERDGTFFTLVKLPPGRYEYMFIIDGQRWVPDPEAPLTRDDGFGRRNSVLDI